MFSDIVSQKYIQKKFKLKEKSYLFYTLLLFSLSERIVVI